MRRLVFTGEQVHYECKSMECCESVALSKTDEWRKYGTAGRVGYFDGYSDSIHEDVYGLSRISEAEELRNHVEESTSRELSYQSDALSALMGILNGLKTHKPPMDTYMGLPLDYPEIQGSDSDPHVTSTVFDFSLLWEHREDRNEKSPLRNRIFPSFFMGWLGWHSFSSPPGCIEVLN